MSEMLRWFEASEKEKKEEGKYFNFPNERMRQDIYLFCKGLATYMADEELKNVVFLDRGARMAWIGVNEYWNMHYKDLKKPGFFFVNPEGFDATGEKTFDRFLQREDEIRNRFSEVYTHLMEKKTEPLVLFDTCSHTGDTIRSVHDTLLDLGFTDVRIITANSPDDVSGIEAAKDISKGTSFTLCYPFGNKSGVKKRDDVVSVRDTGQDQADINGIRNEIKQIIHDGENKSLEPQAPHEIYSHSVDELKVSDKEKRV